MLGKSALTIQEQTLRLHPPKEETPMTAADNIISAFSRARGRALTASELVERTGLSTAAVQANLSRLAEEGMVAAVGVRHTGQRGRPAREFALS